MFNSSVLDIAIGLVLVYLLISILLTSVSETIEAFLKSRASDLEHALSELFQGDQTMLRAFYEHPLISGLYRGLYRRGPATAAAVAAGADGTDGAAAAVANETAPAIAAAAPATMPGGHGNLPSYIPREAFSAAVMDLLESEGGGGDRLKQAVAALGARHGSSPAAIRRAVEGWYDGAMDRASGWFKRRTQLRLFLLGLAIAVIGNVNSVTIAQYLASNQEAREGLVQMASATLPDAAQHGAAPTPKSGAAANPTAPNAAAANADASDVNSVNAAAADIPIGENVTTDGNASTDAATNAAAASADRNAWLRDQHGKLQALGLPIGWSDPVVALMKTGFPAADPASYSGLRWWLALIILLAGYLVTAFAVMLGAPFWFDILNKLMIVRSTVKPREKSPDEPPVDGPAPNPNPGTEEQHP
jgi:hypothetical protein